MWTFVIYGYFVANFMPFVRAPNIAEDSCLYRYIDRTRILCLFICLFMHIINLSFNYEKLHIVGTMCRKNFAIQSFC